MRYGRFTVIENLGLLPTKYGRRRTFVRAQCDCGAIKTIPFTQIASGAIKSCGCLRQETGIEHFKQLGYAHRKPAGHSEFVAMFDVYRRRAKRNSIPFELNLDQFFQLTAAPCHYCGIDPMDGEIFKHNGIDRIDSKAGYSPDNTLPCCQFCNRAKMGKPVEEFESWVNNLTAHIEFRPKGWVSIDKIIDSNSGKIVPIEQAIKYKWITTAYDTRQPIIAEEVETGAPNLFVDQGRQLLAYAFGFRAPIANYTCQNFGVGTGVTAAKITDVALEAPVALASRGGATFAPVTSIDFLTSFVVRVGFTIAASDANGFLLTEYGLFSGNGTLLARFVRSVGINKTSDFAPTLTWRIRF